LGEVSKVVASDYGFHLFQMTEYRAPMERPLEDVQNRVHALLLREKKEAAQTETVAALRGASEISIKEDQLAFTK